MANIFNSELFKQLQESARLQIRDKLPTQLADKVVPVMEVNPKILYNNSNSFSNASTSSGTLLLGTTTTASRDFYITAFNLSFSKDVACDIATGSIYLAIISNGATVILARLPVITLTAQDGKTELALSRPIKVDRGTNISIVSAAHTAGVLNKSGSVIGYYVDNPLA